MPRRNALNVQPTTLATLTSAIGAVLERLTTMTSEQFARGEDRPERQALAEALLWLSPDIAPPVSFDEQLMFLVAEKRLAIKAYGAALPPMKLADFRQASWEQQYSILAAHERLLAELRDGPDDPLGARWRKLRTGLFDDEPAPPVVATLPTSEDRTRDQLARAVSLLSYAIAGKGLDGDQNLREMAVSLITEVTHAGRR